MRDPCEAEAKSALILDSNDIGRGRKEHRLWQDGG